jgi:xylulokinase
MLIGGGARSAAWRQLLADATGATIRVPAETEAGCLGAAMQAIYAYSYVTGKPKSFEEIAERCVRVEESGTATPREEMREAYGRAIEVYRENLERIYGVRL